MVPTSAHQAKNSKVAQGLGRAGMVCYGLVHVMIAYLAIRIAFGASGEQADGKGALQQVGTSGGGVVVLWVLAIGLIAYGGWQLMQAAIGFGWIHEKGKRTRRRIGAAVRVFIGVSLGVYALQLATDSGSGSSGDQQQKEFTAKLLAMPAGQILVAVVAAVVIGVAIGQAVKGVKKSFLEDLDLQDLPRGTQTWVTRLGVFGYLAKAVVLGIIGVLLGFAAFRSDSEEAGGLDQALKTVVAQPFGVAALVVVAVGLAAFGVYCFAAARAHKS